MKMSNLIENTQGICPLCKQVIEASIIDEDGPAYMVKECAEHGSFKTIISKYSYYTSNI